MVQVGGGPTLSAVTSTSSPVSRTRAVNCGALGKPTRLAGWTVVSVALWAAWAVVEAAPLASCITAMLGSPQHLQRGRAAQGARVRHHLEGGHVGRRVVPDGDVLAPQEA